MSNSSPFIEKIENTYKRSDLPEFRPGDTIRFTIERKGKRSEIAVTLEQGRP